MAPGVSGRRSCGGARFPALSAGSAAADEGQERAGRAALAFCPHRSLLAICRTDLINVESARVSRHPASRRQFVIKFAWMQKWLLRSMPKDIVAFGCLGPRCLGCLCN